MKDFLVKMLVIIWLMSSIAYADELQIAVAANFVGTLKKLTPLFEKDSGRLIQGSTNGSSKQPGPRSVRESA